MKYLNQAEMLQIAETGKEKENFMPEIEDKVVVITGAKQRNRGGDCAPAR